MTRDEEIAQFLQGSDYAQTTPVWLDGDASTRRYARVRSADQPTAVLMDAPPQETASNAAFHHMTLALRSAGYSAPDILAADVPRGLMLLEDLGPDLYASVLEVDGTKEGILYSAAVDLLADLRNRPELARDLTSYDTDAYARELALVADWYLPALTGAPAVAEAGALTEAALSAIGSLAPSPVVCVLRDFHAENLLWLPHRPGHARVGLLDYQDALAGHPAYDLVSLLEDARRDTSPALQGAMMAQYAAQTGTAQAEVEAAVAVLGAQRNLKILGIFARLCLRDGKDRYLSLLPRVWGHLQRDLTHPALADTARIAGRILPAPTPELLATVVR